MGKRRVLIRGGFRRRVRAVVVESDGGGAAVPDDGNAGLHECGCSRLLLLRCPRGWL